jgi:hypothetical protein
MYRKYFIANAILWACAIIASAIVNAPFALTAIILPVLAVCSLFVSRPRTPKGTSPQA